MIDFASFDLSDIFGKSDLTKIELECCLWPNVQSALND